MGTGGRFIWDGNLQIVFAWMLESILRHIDGFFGWETGGCYIWDGNL